MAHQQLETRSDVLSIGDLVDELGLPAHMIRRFIDAHDELMVQRRYPRQRRGVPLANLGALRQAMRQAGFTLPTVA